MTERVFAAFVLTYGRPTRVFTYQSLRDAGYTGRIYLIVSDEDPSLGDYRRIYGDQVIAFPIKDAEQITEKVDNFPDRRTVLFARNACFEIAKSLGLTHFVELDDDYGGYYFRRDRRMAYKAEPIRCMNEVFDALLDFLDSTPFVTVTMSQGGDHIGGGEVDERTGSIRLLKRKAMNSFFCSVKKPFRFVGRLNDDVNTYVLLQRAGTPFALTMQVQLNQAMTQASPGGMTEVYRESGTYVKSFYTVIVCPSAASIVVLNDPRSPHSRIHHRIAWDKVAPKILPRSAKKGKKRIESAALTGDSPGAPFDKTGA